MVTPNSVSTDMANLAKSPMHGVALAVLSFGQPFRYLLALFFIQRGRPMPFRFIFQS